jgi:tetratricopeptide (TPR) repeat protein
LSLKVDREGPLCNPAVRLLGHIGLDLVRQRIALQEYQETLATRLKNHDLSSPMIADVYDSIACAYTEIGDVSQAFEYLEKATAIRLANDPNRMFRTSAIFAMTYLRAGQPDQALEALRQCWKLQGRSEEQNCYISIPETQR